MGSLVFLFWNELDFIKLVKGKSSHYNYRSQEVIHKIVSSFFGTTGILSTWFMWQILLKLENGKSEVWLFIINVDKITINSDQQLSNGNSEP